MSNSADGPDLPEWLQQKVDSLRRQLDKGGVRPTGSDHLLDDLVWRGEPVPDIDERNEEMLSLAVNDALNGIDIRTRYPGFYRQMLANVELRNAFLDALDILERSRNNSLEPLPTAPNRNLDFLKEATCRPSIEMPRPRQWRLRWQLSVEQLRRAFNAPEPVMRDGDDLWQEKWLTLFRSEVEVAAEKLVVSLAAVQRIDQTGELTLNISVTSHSSGQSSTTLLPLQAEVQWGDYAATAVIADQSPTVFPTLPLTAVTDASGQLLAGDLHLKLETAGLDPH